MDQQQLREIETRCIQEEQPFCTAACPLHVDVRSFMGSMAKGDIRAARKVLDRTMPFPGILGRLCDQPCRPFCKRGEIGDPLAIGDLEKFCVTGCQAVLKLPKLPLKGGKVVVIGAGLSGMTAALDLARKGRPATLVTPLDSIGGSLHNLPQSVLPPAALEEAAQLLESYGVVLQTAASLDRQGIATMLTEYDAVYCDWDDLDATLLPFVPGTPDPLTLALAQQGCFGGNSGGRAILQAADGRRAALSIERFLQKVSLTAQREKEGSCSTRMLTVTRGQTPAAIILPADPASGYTAEEARAEASRCIACECLECVKQCVYLSEYKEYPKTLARKVYNNQAIVQGSRSANKLINSCSLCGLCTVICPNDFPVAEVCRSARRNMVENGHMPPSAHDFALEDMRFSLSEFCTLSRHQPGTASSRYLFYPGCQLSGSMPDTVKRIYRFLCGQLQGGVALMLGCCGIPASWAGQEEVFRQTLKSCTTEIERLGKPQVITACSSCLSVFQEFSSGMELHSLWEILDSLPLPSESPVPPPGPLTLHDPCTARNQNKLRQSVRNLCAKLNLPLAENEASGELADCCGYGGLMQFANAPLGRKVAAFKAQRGNGAGLAYCAMCRDNLAVSGKAVAHLLDYIFPESVHTDPLTRANPGFSRRHENRARLKAALLSELWGESPEARPDHTDIHLILSPELQDLFNTRHILEEDAQKVIHFAEARGRYLVNPANNHRLASYRPVRVTYWIEYEPSGRGYLIHNGYSHRMQLPESRP